MREKIINGLYGRGVEYIIETLEDWDSYEKMCRETFPEILQYPDFSKIKEDFKKFIGKIWTSESKKRYEVVAMVDSRPNRDWYWLLRNIEEEKDTRYLLFVSRELEEGLNER